ncbi:CPBP family intramembrane glutamic endopeptidase [Salinibius halmophilus]|uniref:CPBP family intramembrane glutamic endopeptidase n=1 Tax=Salinibius halmophilus TaxID=1853216 RepID=UPI000E66422C|nr:type II CAAX endopeptidase family protein [Salinibius halmophilus]
MYPFYKRTLGWLAGFILLFLLVGLVYSSLYTLWQMWVGGLSAELAQQATNAMLNSATGLAWLILLQAIVFISFTLVAMYRLPNMSMNYFLAFAPVSAKNGFWLAGLYVAYLIGQLIIVNWLALDNDAFLHGAAGSRSYFLLIGLAVLAPIYEELFFRGYLHQAWRYTKLRFVGSAVIISIIFALLHGAQYGWVQLGFIFTLSMLLSYARELTGSLRAPIYIHMVNNFLPALGLLFIEAQ